MENAILVGLSKQVATRRELDIVANNLANINTTGYKSDKLLFEEYMMPVAKHENFRFSDRKLSFVQDHKSYHDLSEGEVQVTDNPLDLRIQGDGYFVINTPEGERYTRNGAFQINPDGAIVTNEGFEVQGEGGTITLDNGITDIVITPEGEITTNEGAIGQFRVVRFETPENLNKISGTMFKTTEDPLPIDERTSIQQGMLEKSNVQPITQMVALVEVNRAYTRLNDMLKQASDLRKDAIGQLGNAQLR